MSTSSKQQQRLSSTKQPQERAWILGGVVVLVCCLAIRLYSGMPSADAKSPLSGFLPGSAAKKKAAPAKADTRPAEPPKPQIVAMVNTEEINRDELARECVFHYGEEVLESLVNKHLISSYCQQHGVVVSTQEIDEEIDRMARKFSMPKDQWLKMLEKERNIKPSQYAKDIVWPTLALRKLASAELTVTQQELEEAFESQYGPSVKARLISVRDRALAEEIRAKAVASPEEFGALARKHSQDVNSASANGMIQPIRRHLGESQLENVAFSLRKGEISPVIAVANQFVILKCEDHLPAARANREAAAPLLQDAIRDRKLRTVATELFQTLQKTANVENIYNDPKKSKQMPGVAALLNGQKITMRELAEECVDRHGQKVLEGVIHRRLLEQGLRKRNLAVTQQEINAEIARAAKTMGKVKPSGKPDIQGWLAVMTKQQGVGVDLYIRDAVWPSVALKKLTGNSMQITEKELQMGFQANYGPRVRCRAIVLSNQRKAQQVWEMARNNPTVKYFGDLAEQYSVEASSRALRGEVPPIQRHGGQPLLEREAFALQKGELSGVIQVGENYVILLCEGYTQPTKVEFAEVRGLIYEDLKEKKERIAMSKQFEQLEDAAQIDNYLAGTVKSPKAVAQKPGALQPGTGQPSTAQPRSPVRR